MADTLHLVLRRSIGFILLAFLYHFLMALCRVYRGGFVPRVAFRANELVRHLLSVI